MSYHFKVRKENNFNPDYEINLPEYSKDFSTCPVSKSLVKALRENGFIVALYPNIDFILGMINTAVSATGQSNYVDTKINGEIAVAYGYGKIIGFSSYDDDFRGYNNGKEHILWDKFGEFDKWSRCNIIKKDKEISLILSELL